MDPEELDNETDWAPEGSFGHDISNIFELGRCVPVMCNDDWGVIFTAGGNFYDTSLLIDFEVRQITFPRTLEEIIALMKEQGYWGLKFEDLPLHGKQSAPIFESVYLERWREATRKA